MDSMNAPICLNYPLTVIKRIQSGSYTMPGSCTGSANSTARDSYRSPGRIREITEKTSMPLNHGMVQKTVVSRLAGWLIPNSKACLLISR